ncbi:MAG: hypothetical protein R3251_01735 [Candidatus Spechtbacterales bacterium]|nr:hypothetical protein [Candidatus Spechtbacterales bacterium]
MNIIPSKENIDKAYKSFRTVFKKPVYIFLASVITLVIFSISIWMPNLPFIVDIISSETASATHKLNILLSLLGGIATNFTFWGAVFIIFISVLVGINISFSVYYFKQRLSFQRASGVSLIGMLVGLLGVGCASCGSVVLASIIGLGATASLVGFLPLNGQEINIVAVIILMFSLYITAKKAYDPLICEVK